MKNHEAKFILGAYRPDGRDASDPAFAEALAQAEHDPELRAWFEQHRKFDAACSAKLQSIAPPPGLREAILAGSRVSAAQPQPKRRWWSNPTWLAAAAAIAIVAGLGFGVHVSHPRPGGAEVAALALRDLEEAHENHVGHPPQVAEVQAQLANAPLPLASTLKLDLADLQKKNCRSITIAGRQMFEICFRHDGNWYHVYVGRRSDFAPGTLDPKALLQVRDQYAATVWADANNVYALVTHAGPEALRRVI
jgi:hypothetical protein